ncbi:MAG: TetR family transcriptional regulator [Acidobacteria bacterium]|nr:TetR family transcriptional regulator [Acidobacteriota bacterium]
MPVHKNGASRLGSRGQPERTRRAILDAALREFGEKGMAGARTDAIARSAGVNKALLYYYFSDKEALYGSVLEHAFQALSRQLIGVLESDLPCREKVLAYAGAHFDWLARSPLLPQLVHREMMQAARPGSPQVRRIAVQHLRPIFRRLAAMVREGVESGEFRQVDAMQFVISMAGIIVHYFTSAPIAEFITGEDPFTRARLRARRGAVLEVIAAALFAPRGARQRRGARPGKKEEAH